MDGAVRLLLLLLLLLLLPPPPPPNTHHMYFMPRDLVQCTEIWPCRISGDL
jgi:hypothetical protein